MASLRGAESELEAMAAKLGEKTLASIADHLSEDPDLIDRLVEQRRRDEADPNYRAGGVSISTNRGPGPTYNPNNPDGPRQVGVTVIPTGRGSRQVGQTTTEVLAPSNAVRQQDWLRRVKPIEVKGPTLTAEEREAHAREDERERLRRAAQPGFPVPLSGPQPEAVENTPPEATTSPEPLRYEVTGPTTCSTLWGGLRAAPAIARPRPLVRLWKQEEWDAGRHLKAAGSEPPRPRKRFIYGLLIVGFTADGYECGEAQVTIAAPHALGAVKAFQDAQPEIVASNALGADEVARYEIRSVTNQGPLDI